jgi:hypothetical protein
LFERQIIIQNNTPSPIRIFPSVNAITLDEQGEIKEFVAPAVVDRSNTITAWVAFPRGRIELPPGASTTLTVAFSIDQAAVSGVYHAFLGLGSGSSRDEAEAQVFARSAPGVLIRVAVKDTRTESLRLSRFTVTRVLTRTDQDAISISLTNPGDLPITPYGEVTLYNGRGEAIATTSVNEGRESILPGESKDFTAPIETTGMFGRYKAFLSLEYGSARATVHDTAFFYAAPWAYLVGLFIVLFLGTLGMLLWSRRSLGADEEDERFDYVTMSVRTGTSSVEHGYDITLKKTDEREPS